jgi:23S rRNA pseudouridine2605 synthase
MMISTRFTKSLIQSGSRPSFLPRFLTNLVVEDGTTVEDNTNSTTPSKPAGIRLSQLIAGTGLASRRESERIIHEKRVTIAGKVCNLPCLIVPTEQRPLIEIDGVPLRTNYQTMPRLWAVLKQSGEIMSEQDPQKSRPVLLDRMKNIIMPQLCTQFADQLRPLYRLDYIIEGLTLYTNNGELAKLIHQQNLPMIYRIRINGLLTDSKLRGLLAGLHVKNESFAPMQIEIENESNTMSWLKVTTKEKQFHAVHKAFKHLFLNITRGICVGYGPFHLKEIFPADMTLHPGYVEVKLSPTLHAAYMKLQHSKYFTNNTTTTATRSTNIKKPLNKPSSIQKRNIRKGAAAGVPKLSY